MCISAVVHVPVCGPVPAAASAAVQVILLTAAQQSAVYFGLWGLLLHLTPWLQKVSMIFCVT
jgi:hypothetical protein